MAMFLYVDCVSWESGVRLDHAVDDLDPVAGAPRRRVRFVDHAARPVLEADGDFIALARLHPLLDFVAGHCAAHGADHGRDVLSAPATNLVAENATHNRPADCADAGSCALRGDLAHRLDDTAFGAPPSG